MKSHQVFLNIYINTVFLILDNCLYGDQKTVTFNGVTRTCSDFLDANNDNYCDYPSVSRPCCQTCAERRNDANPSKLIEIRIHKTNIL